MAQDKDNKMTTISTGFEDLKNEVNQIKEEVNHLKKKIKTEQSRADSSDEYIDNDTPCTASHDGMRTYSPRKIAEGVSALRRLPVRLTSDLYCKCVVSGDRVIVERADFLFEEVSAKDVNG